MLDRVRTFLYKNENYKKLRDFKSRTMRSKRNRKCYFMLSI